MPLTIKPPRPQSQEPAPDSADRQPTVSSSDHQRLHPRPPSPVAPAYSPITPKAQPVLPATYSQHEPAEVPPVPPPSAAAQHIQEQNHASITSSSNGTPNSQRRGTPPAPQVAQQPGPPPPAPQPSSSIQPTQYVPQPANLPFSSDDATDAIALRAAISTLQFQKQKAQDDLRKLERIKQQAQAEPERFRTELAAGRLKEQKPTIGNLQSILDQVEDSDDDDEIVLDIGQKSGDNSGDTEMADANTKPNEVLDSQMSEAGLPPTTDQQGADKEPNPFPPIPGPQSIVRMPPVNWDKYHVVGQPLDSLHEQQRRWPGQQPFTADRGREHVVAAPYSPFQDRLGQEASSGGAQQQSTEAEGRKDSRAMSDAFAPSPLSGPGEHPMATRRISERRP